MLEEPDFRNLSDTELANSRLVYTVAISRARYQFCVLLQHGQAVPQALLPVYHAHKRYVAALSAKKAAIASTSELVVEAVNQKSDEKAISGKNADVEMTDQTKDAQ